MRRSTKKTFLWQPSAGRTTALTASTESEECQNVSVIGNLEEEEVPSTPASPEILQDPVVLEPVNDEIVHHVKQDSETPPPNLIVQKNRDVLPECCSISEFNMLYYLCILLAACAIIGFTMSSQRKKTLAVEQLRIPKSTVVQPDFWIVENDKINTMDQKTLSYDALRSVLGHMEANKRIQIAITCPSLQKVEKSIPLKIDRLGFVSNYEVQINNNFYDFGIIRQYREGTAPEPFRSMNKNGGLNCDLDEWGFRKPSYRLTETPGDINFGDVLEDSDEGNDEDIEREVRKFRFFHSGDKAVVNGRPKKMSVWWMNTGYKLLPYRCRKNNVNPAHDCFVQLNLTTGEIRQPVQKVPYTKKLHEMMKAFMTFIFGGRSCSVQVNCLEIYSTTQIIRLPVGVKFSVHELRVPRKVSSILKFLLPFE